jgi:peptide/nickel transport system permease protein
MFAFIARRLVATIPVLLFVAIFVFMLLRLTPGDPAAVIAGDNATSDQVEAIRAKLGLNEPIYRQFFIWSGKALNGDFGESFFFKKTVAELIAQRIEPTAMLALCTLILAVSIAVPLGVLAAAKQGGWVDRVVMGFSVMGFSVPTFVIGYLLIYLFAIQFGLLPVQGYRRIAEGFGDFIIRLILPSITLAVVYIALISRITRASVIETLGEDYIRTARAKGLPGRTVLLRHALRNAAVPIITVIGIGIALLIGGVVVTESVYNIPGVGRLTVDAVLARDFPVIQVVILMFSFVYVLINLLIDIAYSFFDPRIRY